MTLNTEFALTTQAISTLANPDLKKSIHAMMMAIEAGKKSIWDYATAITNIVVNKQFEQDFTTKENFAKSLNISPSTLVMYTKATIYMEQSGYERPFPLTVGKAYMLSTCSPVVHIEVMERIEQMGLNLLELSEKALKEIIESAKAMFKAEEKRIKESIDGEAGESDSETEDVSRETYETDSEPEEKVAMSVYRTPEGIYTITVGNDIYDIPAPRLAKFKRKEEKSA